VLPILAVFLQGRVASTFTMATYIIATLVYMISSTATGQGYAFYTGFYYLMHLITLLTVWMMSVLLRTAWKDSEAKILKQKDDLAKTQELLAEQVVDLLDAKTKAEESLAELESKNEELRTINEMVVGRELKMIELKQRIAELEGQQK
ncbi:hypothetical protein KC963_01510, partial [Candidatus Saccharibacteria bacterium]|nr:hypothetical protein [Candidatus Saccharibacteria bacterium]